MEPSSLPPPTKVARLSAVECGPAPDSDLLSRVRQFLPQLAEANERLADGGGSSTEDGVVVGADPTLLDDSEDDDEEADDDDDDGQEGEIGHDSSPSIKLKTKIAGPIETKADIEGDDDNGNGDGDADGDEDSGSHGKQAVVSQLLREKRPRERPKGPLIQELS